MADLRNHPGSGYWLRDDAEASLARMEHEYTRPFSISDAGRTPAQQEQLLARWRAGGVYNRPPYLYEPASASVSPHVINGGTAVDFDNSAERSWIRDQGGKHGWRFNIGSDPVHAIYEPWNDQFAGGAGTSGGDQDVRNQQLVLNAHRGEHLTVDGILGPDTRAAIGRYQEFLRAYGYTGSIDGIWGPATQAAHAVYFGQPAPQPQPPAPTPEVTGVKWNGIQEMLRALYGYTGGIDGIAGNGTISAFQRFLATNSYEPGGVDGVWGPNTAKAAQRWLRARWGYSGSIDGVFGPQTLAAWSRAEAENAAAF